jgi:hypothetical protein
LGNSGWFVYYEKIVSKMIFISNYSFMEVLKRFYGGFKALASFSFAKPK